MKRIFIFLILLLGITSSAYALNLDFTSDMSSFRRGVGITDIAPITVIIDNDNEITKDKGFSLVLTQETAFRFYQYQSASVSGTTKVDSGVTVMPSMKTINFRVKEDLKKGDSFTVSGLKIFITRLGSPETRQVGLDTMIGQVYWTANSIRINDLPPITSIDLPPSEVFNLTGSIVGSNVILSGDNPGDSDFNNIQILLLDKNKSELSSTFVTVLNKYSLAFGNADYVQIKTTNFHSGISPGLIFPISYFDQSTNVTTTNTGTINTQTGSADNLVLIEKYSPIFFKYKTTLNRFIIIMDTYIASKLDINSSVYFQNQVMVIRNKIAKICEELDKSTLLDRKDIMIRLKAGVTELKLKLIK